MRMPTAKNLACPPPVQVQPPEPPGREEPEEDEPPAEKDLPAEETGWELGAGHWIVIGVIALATIVVAGVLIKKKR